MVDKKNLFEGRATTQTKNGFFFFSSQPFFVRSGKCGEKIGIFSVTKKRKNYEFVCL